MLGRDLGVFPSVITDRRWSSLLARQFGSGSARNAQASHEAVRKTNGREGDVTRWHGPAVLSILGTCDLCVLRCHLQGSQERLEIARLLQIPSPSLASASVCILAFEDTARRTFLGVFRGRSSIARMRG